ncbi:uncharacterized protein LOC129739194 [Uranotaenia lowii]|uniref:uncharacterized protein LOC129739194 n=1 Tax=Uranotaenia lowii TaxID=190385 RepID=UPI002479DE74|nr:uncharacterized protein LOC129739194 [Uranotaenia lowii]
MNINNLPVEVLELIFHHLPVRDRKVGAEVCHLWAQIVSGWSCMADVDLVIKVSLLSIESPAISHRRYRNLFLRVDRELNNNSRITISNVLFGYKESLERLRISWELEDRPIDLFVFLWLLSFTPGLRVLIVEDCNETWDETSEMPSSSSIPCLVNLETVELPCSLMDNINFNLCLLAPKIRILIATINGRHAWTAIQELSGQLSSLTVRTETENNLQPFWWNVDGRKLNQLTLSKLCYDLMDIVDVNPSDASQFFSCCSSLTALRLELHVPLSVIRIVVQSCPLLTKLLVYDLDDGMAFLVAVQPLQQLTHLTVMETSFESKPSTNFLLPKVVSLTLHSVEFRDPSLFFQHLNNATPNLRSLKLSRYAHLDDSQPDASVLRALLSSNLHKLRKLTLANNNSFPSHLFSHINLLSNLVDLRLDFFGLNPWVRFACVPTIQRMVLSVGKLSQVQLRALLRVFSALIRLDLIVANPSSEETILDYIHEIVRNCPNTEINVWERKNKASFLDEWFGNY